MRKFIFILVSAIFAISALSCCEEHHSPQKHSTKHPLVGAWLAEDGTIFIFRNDGTMHGIDFHKKEIWGNWVVLSHTRIGFQSLLHDSYYLPQYAIIDKANQDSMDYIVTGGNSFIKASRISVKKAAATVELVAEPQLYYPKKTEQGAAANP